jgi:cytoskeletal protein RodZ
MATIPPDGSAQPVSPGEQPPSRNWRAAAIVLICVLAALVIVALIWFLAIRPAGGTPTASPTPSNSQSASPSKSPSASPSGTTTPTSAIQRCTVDELSVTLGQGNGAAGSEIVPIIFTNKGSKACELHGFPGVSFVGNNNGTQLGAAADEDSSTPISQNTLQPGTSIQAPLKITEAGNFEGCTVTPADGLRVYPPHSFDAVFVPATGLNACTEPTIHLLSVKPVGSAVG